MSLQLALNGSTHHEIPIVRVNATFIAPIVGVDYLKDIMRPLIGTCLARHYKLNGVCIFWVLWNCASGEHVSFGWRMHFIGQFRHFVYIVAWIKLKNMRIINTLLILALLHLYVYERFISTLLLIIFSSRSFDLKKKIENTAHSILIENALALWKIDSLTKYQFVVSFSVEQILT